MVDSHFSLTLTFDTEELRDQWREILEKLRVVSNATYAVTSIGFTPSYDDEPEVAPLELPEIEEDGWATYSSPTSRWDRP
jgi:hypothetical protein